MSRKKIIVSCEDLVKANERHQSANQAAKSLGLTYQTFNRRCKEHGIQITKNPSGKGLSATERYGEKKAKELALALSVSSSLRTCSAETRDLLRSKALARIDRGEMPSKGLKGYYNGIWFDSSWELAYYLWMIEVFDIEPKRNKTIFFDYIGKDGVKRRTKPDFILPSGELIEIKGYPNIHTSAKFEATKSFVSYLFRKDLKEALSFVKAKYGKDFTKKFYASVGKLVDPAE
jgi:hypothetical protein